MIRSVFIIVCLTIASTVTAQELGKTRLFMTKEQNLHWLRSVKTLNEKKQQWKAIHDRFLAQTVESATQKGTDAECPLFLIDGVPYEMNEHMSDKSRQQLSALLTPEKIGSIAIVDKEPENTFINKSFAGIVLITVNDRKTKNRLRKLKLV